MSPMKPAPETTVLGKMLRTFRAIQGWDLKTMAMHIDISAPTLMRIEHGRAFDAETWMKIQNFMMRRSSEGRKT